MSDIVKTEQSGLVGFLHNAGGNGQLTIPKPFEKDIFSLTPMWPAPPM